MTAHRLFAALLLAAALPAGGRAQLIPVKTVPVAAGDQFLLFPSQNLGMGGVGLALADTLGDPFSNPATGARITESLFFGSPTYYGISGRNGSGRTLPVGALFASDGWFGGGGLALQEIKGAERWQLQPWIWGWRPPENLSEASARNLYAFALLGYRFPESGISVGVGAQWADLGAVDGVDLLYALSQEIRQSGHLADLRVGVMKEWEGDRSLELVLLRNRFRMRHDVTYIDMVWEPIPPDTIDVFQLRTREEKNLDHTDTWGAHLAYRRPLQTPGWTVGWSVTANRKDHPKIPNYEIQNIPRDPGDTWAYGVGGGIAKVEGPTRFGVDLFLEPIRSETWADAASDTTTADGDVIHAGERTVENDFRFINALVRAGVGWDWRWATFQGGIQIRSISWELDQYNLVEEARRKQDESWMEWTPSLGVTLRLPGMSIHYTGRMTTGTGRPGTQWTGQRGAVLETALASDFIVAPEAPLTLQDARVTTHRIAVSVPIR